MNEMPKEDIVVVLRRVHRQLSTGLASIINPKLVADAADEIERLRTLIRVLVENDPNDYAADAVTVLDVWRKDAREVLGK